MNIHAITTILFAVAIVLSVGGTAWYISRLRYDQGQFPIDFLAQQARPRGKVVSYALWGSVLCIFAAFFADFFADPKGIQPVFGVLALAIIMLSQLIQHALQRIRALEAIIRLSLPEVYSKIKGV